MFSVPLRAAVPTSVEHTRPFQRVSPAPVRRGRVLALDDDPIIRSVVRRLLGRDHDVVALRTEQIAEGARYDVALCDLTMPALSGIELHAALARMAPEQADA